VTTEDDFNAALDADPEDWQTRLVYADWLQERGDERAEGYRALGMARHFPGRSEFSQPHRWGFTNPANDVAGKHGWGSHVLPREWWEVMDPGEVSREDNPWWNWHPSRREAEDAAALAFAGLPPERRAELLAAAPPARKPKRKKATPKKPAAQKPKAKMPKGKKK
jgi:uncharacterized protein (TIGR02996 family)